MGHPLLSQFALPHRVSIYTGVSGEMIPAMGVPTGDIPSTLDIHPLPALQTISRLPDEPLP